MTVEIRAMEERDWPAVAEIYWQGIGTGNATFETMVPPFETWNRAHHPHSRLVATTDGEVVGWAALSPVSARRAYAGVAEVTVYVAEAAQGKGVGRALLSALVNESERNGCWSLRAAILSENEASIALHKRCGFRVVGHYERVARDIRGNWRDVTIMERRSRTVGVE
ncbi:N-acetyltransferase family protein [Synergistaceae bacterium OttesenSCG-928-I11]|nr:N-acetyltransferase family protein [Synergistaceae bacterium OttesenSCG-928-I11]